MALLITSFRVSKFIDRNHGRAARFTFGLGGWMICMIMTGRQDLAARLRGVFRRGQIKQGLHWARWYLHHGWARPFTRRSPFFDFTEPCDAATLALLETRIMRRAANGDTGDLADLMYVTARQAGLDDAAWQTHLPRYIAAGQRLVDKLPLTAQEPTRSARSKHFTRDDAKTALVAAGACLDRIGLAWFVISGTFLGAVREGGFLSHDYDIDIGVMAEDFDAETFRQGIRTAPDLTFTSLSDYAHRSLGPDGQWQVDTRPALYKIKHRSGLSIDIFVHHTEDGQCWHGSAKHRWTNSAFGLAEYDLDGIIVRGPADADRYLTENYGTWRIPVTRFSCSTGTPNVSFNRNLAAIAQFLRRAIVSQEYQSGQVARLVLEQEGYLSIRNGELSFDIPWGTLAEGPADGSLTTALP